MFFATVRLLTPKRATKTTFSIHLDVLQQLRPSFLGGLPMCFDAWHLLKKLADGSLEIFFEDNNLDCFTVYGDNEDD